MNDGRTGGVLGDVELSISSKLLQRTFSEQDHGNWIECSDADAQILVDDDGLDSQTVVEPAERTAKFRVPPRGQTGGWKNSSRVWKSWERHVGNARRLANMGRAEKAEAVAIFSALPKARMWMFGYDRPVPFVWEMDSIDRDMERELQRTDEQWEKVDISRHADDFWFENSEYHWYDDWYGDGSYLTEEEQIDYLSFCLGRRVTRHALYGSYAVDCVFEEIEYYWLDQALDDYAFQDPSIEELEEREYDRYWEGMADPEPEPVEEDDSHEEPVDCRNAVDALWEEEDDTGDDEDDDLDLVDHPLNKLPHFERLRSRRHART